MRRTIHVRPRSSRNHFGGSYDGLLVIRVRQPAAEDQANRAVVVILADALGVSPRAVRITAGSSSRRKVVDVEGEDRSLESAWELLLSGD